jgi:hypothetical protein
MTDLLNSALSWDACMRVWMCEWMRLSFESSMLLRPVLASYGRGEEEGVCPLLSIILVFPLKYPWMLTHGRGCIGSSGNVRVGRLAIGVSWWNMGKLIFPGEWRLYVKSLQLSMWSSFKASCLGYPNHIHSYIQKLKHLNI